MEIEKKNNNNVSSLGMSAKSATVEELCDKPDELSTLCNLVRK